MVSGQAKPCEIPQPVEELIRNELLLAARSLMKQYVFFISSYDWRICIGLGLPDMKPGNVLADVRNPTYQETPEHSFMNALFRPLEQSQNRNDGLIVDLCRRAPQEAVVCRFQELYLCSPFRRKFG